MGAKRRNARRYTRRDARSAETLKNIYTLVREAPKRSEIQAFLGTKRRHVGAHEASGAKRRNAQRYTRRDARSAETLKSTYIVAREAPKRSEIHTLLGTKRRNVIGHASRSRITNVQCCWTGLCVENKRFSVLMHTVQGRGSQAFGVIGHGPRSRITGRLLDPLLVSIGRLLDVCWTLIGPLLDL